MIGYVYAANGPLLGKGNLTTFSCDVTKNGLLTANGLALTNAYMVGPRSERLEETDGNFNMLHYNVFWEGKLLGTFTGTTYAQSNWHFALNDWLGTKREITTSTGAPWTSLSSGPFGDYVSQTGSGSNPSEEFFTNKVRDTESGLDDFLARHYSSNWGRFMSPDWSEGVQPIPYADPANPQSLNLYAYVNNNPLSNTDQDGHSCDQGSVGPDGVFTFKCQNDPTLLDEFMQEIRTDPNQQRTLIAQKGLTLPNGHPLDAGVLNGMSDNAVNSLAHQLAAQQYAQIMSALNSIPFKSSWGWNNSPAYIKARNELKTPGDHPDLNGKVPTREEANQMIQEAGGSVDRNDPGHAPGGVSTHTDPHVNYTTPSGQKATVTVREQ